MSAHASQRGTRRTFRPTRAVPAALLAALLAGGGALAVIEMIAALAGRPGYLFPGDGAVIWATETPWNAPEVIVFTVALTLLGLACLLLGLRPGRPRFVALRTGDPDLVLGVTRHGLCRALATAVEGVDGVRRVRRVRLLGDHAVIHVVGEPDERAVAAAWAGLAALGVRDEIAPVIRTVED